MNKKLILGISVGVSITSILVGSIIFAVEFIFCGIVVDFIRKHQYI